MSQVILGREPEEDKIFNDLVQWGYTQTQAETLVDSIKIVNREDMRVLRNISETLYAKVKLVKLSNNELQHSYLFAVFNKILSFNNNF